MKQFRRMTKQSDTELKIAIKFNHPNIVTVLGVEEEVRSDP